MRDENETGRREKRRRAKEKKIKQREKEQGGGGEEKIKKGKRVLHRFNRVKRELTAYVKYCVASRHCTVMKIFQKGTKEICARRHLQQSDPPTAVPLKEVVI